MPGMTVVIAKPPVSATVIAKLTVSMFVNVVPVSQAEFSTVAFNVSLSVVALSSKTMPTVAEVPVVGVLPKPTLTTSFAAVKNWPLALEVVETVFKVPVKLMV